MKQSDVIVIGGGIVGLATAKALVEQTGASVRLLEKEDRLSAHQTGNNSGVIHSGLYYKTGSLKARNCVEGRELLYRFCEERGIPAQRCGKVVVATRQDELPAMEELERRGGANGLEGLRRISPAELREIEPHTHGITGLFVPATGIVDYIRVSQAYADVVRERGGEIELRSRVTKIEARADGLTLETPAGEFRCHHLINCAGLQSDRVARLGGVDPQLRIVPFRGEYYELRPERHGLVHNLIYPVPDARFPFLGVHFTRMIGGGVEAGPNAVLAFKREGYHKTSFNLKDIASFACYPGFWKMALKFWPMGVGEYYRSFVKGAFVKALQRLIPEIEAGDLIPGGAGVRAQALEPAGGLSDDFRIRQAPHQIHVLNAPSPAATASLAIGRSIARMAMESFSLPARQ